MQESRDKPSKTLQKMIPKKTNNQQNNALFQRLSEQLNPRHELYRLADRINWQLIDEEFAGLFKPTFNAGQPPKPIRLMVGLMLLQNLHGLSDQAAIARWVENPYWLPKPE